VPAVIGAHHTLTKMTSGGTRFYRLRHFKTRGVIPRRKAPLTRGPTNQAPGV